jgi:hypothetical protein
MSVTDSITIGDYITVISLGISVVSIVLVIYLQSRWRKLTQVQNHVQPSEDNVYEVSAIVSEFGSRLKRLEEGLVDLKVKQEILDLRVARSSANPFRAEVKPLVSSRSESSYLQAETSDLRSNSKMQADSSEIVSRVPPSNKLTQDTSEKKQLGGTELEALRIVFEGRGRISAKEIQQKIDRTREHTARMMSSLYREGLVERDITARPFSYSITQKGRDLLNG